MSRIKKQNFERDDGYDLEYATTEDFVSLDDHKTLKNQMQARFGILQNKIIYTISGLVFCFVGLLGFSIYIMVSQNNEIKFMKSKLSTKSDENLQISVQNLTKLFRDDIEEESEKVRSWFESWFAIVGGDGKTKGNLYFAQYPICDDEWNDISANVACRMMGFERVCIKHNKNDNNCVM